MSEPFDELDALDFEELRQRAFQLAEHRRDVGFFWDLLRHLPSAGDLGSEDASSGNITGSVEETVELVREIFGRGLGDTQPLLRARFIDYLQQHAG